MTYSISRYLNTQMAYGPSFTADGRSINFISNMTGIPQLWRVDLPQNAGKPCWPQQLTFEQDRVQSAIASRVPNDNRVIYNRDRGGNENAQLYLLDPATATETLLTDGYEQAMHIPGEWSKDGEHILFAANRRNPGIFDLYVMSLTDGTTRMIWEHETHGYLISARFSPDGSRTLVARMQSSFHSELFEIDLTSKGRRLVSPEAESARFLDAAYAHDGQSVFVLTDYESDFLRLVRLDLNTQTMTPVYTASWDVEGLEVSPDGRKLAFGVNEDGASKLYLHDIESGSTQPIPTGDSPGVSVTGMAFSPDSSMLAYDFIAATRVSDVYVYDLHADAVYPVTQSSHGGLPLDSFVAPEAVTYPTFDNDESGSTRQIPAWLYRPPNVEGDVPVVIIVHGGPEGQSRPVFNFLAQYLLQYGYAVMLPNVRGSIGYGKAYSHLDDVEKRMDSVADLAYAAYWLKEQPGINGERIVVYGGSYGGFMVLAAVTHYPDLWVAGVNIVGISNLATFLENTSDYRRTARETEYGSLAHDREFLERIAPINHIDRITVPLLVIHGANDPRVPLSEAEQMVAALEAQGTPVELLVFDDEGHGVIKLNNKLVMYPRVVEFLERYAAQL